jgi:hypothetical protein
LKKTALLLFPFLAKYLQMQRQQMVCIWKWIYILCILWQEDMKHILNIGIEEIYEAHFILDVNCWKRVLYYMDFIALYCIILYYWIFSKYKSIFKFH